MLTFKRTTIGLVAMTLGYSVLGFRKEIIPSAHLSYPFSAAVRAGNFVYLSGMLPTDQQGNPVAGTIQEQTKLALTNVAGVLLAADSQLGRVASVSVYLKNASDFEAMNEVYRTFWPKDPPARTTVVTDLPSGALVQIAMVAVRNGVERRVVHPEGWKKSPNYSYGILSGDTLFLAGLVSRNMKDSSIVEGNIGIQTKTVLGNAGEILQAAGMSHSDVVSSRVFLTDAARFQDMNAAYRPFFAKHPPARATVKAALMNPQFAVEITLLAVKSNDREAINPPGPDGPPYSSAIRVGNRLYVAGMVGGSETSKGDMRAQTRESLDRIGKTVRAAGFDWAKVVDAIVYVTDLKRSVEMNEAYRETFPADFPARTVVGIEIVIPNPMVEIMLTAVK